MVSGSHFGKKAPLLAAPVAQAGNLQSLPVPPGRAGDNSPGTVLIRAITLLISMAGSLNWMVCSQCSAAQPRVHRFRLRMPRPLRESRAKTRASSRLHGHQYGFQRDRHRRQHGAFLDIFLHKAGIEGSIIIASGQFPDGPSFRAELGLNGPAGRAATCPRVVIPKLQLVLLFRETGRTSQDRS